jgi:hypothetical protein
MVILKIFFIYYYIDYRIISIKAICRFCKSLPYRDTADISLIPMKFITSTSPALLDSPVSLLYIRLPYRSFIIISNTIIIAYSSAFNLVNS